ncbi:ester cyclase [Psychroserpens jangbogonensis]|uniref:ester cyclase n=1 Tax=Psychroserpens jangbogonensis TaxID=1484460 RepID=UPI0009DE3BC3|nr:ester cyclase [Psychroserpens jangbogonensis]
MKKLPILVFLSFITIAMAFGQNKSTESNIKMYAQVWDDIMNKGQIDNINPKYFDANITAISSPENIVGIENFKAYYQNFITGFSDIDFTVVDVFGQGDNIVKHWNFKGKHTGEFFGIPATNRSVDIQGVTLVKMKDGKISQEQDFMDNTVFMQQLGLLSNPDNVGIINSVYENFSKGDIPSVLGMMDPKIVWNEAESNSLADGNPYIGPDAVLAGVFSRLGDKYASFSLQDIQLHDMANNQVLATLRYNAKMKTTEKDIDVQAAHLWSLKDGKIIEFQQYVDTKKLADSEGK